MQSASSSRRGGVNRFAVSSARTSPRRNWPGRISAGSVFLERLGARADALLTRFGSHESIQLHIDRAGVDARAGAFVCLDLLIGFGAFVLLLGWKGTTLAVAGGAAGVATPWIVLHVRGLRRSRAFEQQLPEILDTLAASLRAGHGFDHGLQTVATDVGEPAGREFRRVVAEVHLGRSLEDALAELGRRIRSADLRFVLDAIAIQRQVGGSLAELFELVATTVRAREQFRRNLVRSPARYASRRTSSPGCRSWRRCC